MSDGFVVEKKVRLSKLALGAIIEALTERLAGEMDGCELHRKHYERALSWAQDRAERK